MFSSGQLQDDMMMMMTLPDTEIEPSTSSSTLALATTRPKAQIFFKRNNDQHKILLSFLFQYRFSFYWELMFFILIFNYFEKESIFCWKCVNRLLLWGN